MTHYLIEFRFHGYAKKYIKKMIFDVSKKYKVKGVTKKRPVPHITLFGPFTTRKIKKVVSIVEDIGKKYNLVPFKVKGFGHINKNVIYVNIKPSRKLKKLRRELAKELSQITTTKPHDNKRFWFVFHVTIVFKDITNKFEKILEYLENKEVKNINQHLLRITIIKNSKILYEYDLMQRRLLNRRQAKSKYLWKKTINILKRNIR